MRDARALETFDPATDIARRWPDWSVYESTDIPAGAEQFFPASRAAFIDPSAHGADWALAHVTAHLDLGHHETAGVGGFTPEQEADASWLTSLRMDAWPLPDTPAAL